ncbi:hypothetical protein FQZ97_1132820 [compost metagenome]
MIVRAFQGWSCRSRSSSARRMWWMRTDQGHHHFRARLVSRSYGLNSHQRPMYMSLPSADMMWR